MDRLCRGMLLGLCMIVLLKIDLAKGKLSDHHKKKYERQLTLLDTNHDGIIELADFKRMADPISKIGCTRFTKKQIMDDLAPKAFNGYPGKSMTKKEFMQAAETRDCNSSSVIDGIKDLANVMFDAWNCKDEGNDEAMTVKEFLDEFKSVSIENTVNKKEFKQLDTNHDGCISSEEFLSGSLVKKALDAMDANKDGVLSRDEYVDAVTRFICSTDDNDSSYLLVGWI